MSIEMIAILFVASVILCAVAGDIVKRKKIQVPRLVLVIFHAIYITGLVAVYILM